MITIRKAAFSDAAAVAALALQLWPDHDTRELQTEFESLLTDEGAAVFLACVDETPVGFAQCQLRHDYVEGTHTSPVGYLEGIYVRETHRHHGIARHMLAACERWSREMGCQEFASDCELANTQSFAFHQQLGFTEANRIICFTKQL